MPESYQVMKANLKRTIPAKDQWPEKHVYSLLLDPQNGGQPLEAEELRHHKATPPQQGEHAEGDVVPGNFGLTFKRARTDGPLASAAPTKASDGRDSYRKHPAEVAGARRAHSQDMALREAQVRALVDREGFGKIFSQQWLKETADWYTADAQEASERA